MNLIKSKKAQQHNYFAVIIVLFLFGFISILTYTLWLNFVTALTDAGFASSSPVAATIAAWTNGFRALDYVMVLLLVFLILATGLTSYLIRTDSAFFIVTLIAGLFWGFVSYFFNHIFIQMVSQSIFDTAIGFFPRTLIICTNLHWIMLVLIIVGSITLYGKKKKETADSFLT
jgi:hypothetical protein